MRTSWRRIVVVAVSLVALSIPEAAAAHPTTLFHLCTMQTTNFCSKNGTKLYGQTVTLRARVKPSHVGYAVVVLRRRPCRHPKFVGTERICRFNAKPGPWKSFARTTVGGHGRASFVWKTRRTDAVQDAPYYFKFKIRGHGVSNTIIQWVIYGE